MEADSGSGSPSRVMNPLWIISLFLGVAEVTAGVVVSQSSGWVQGLLAVFATVFPVGVAVAFFMIVWRRPYVLYAPGDFSEHTTVANYVEAMSGNFQPAAAIEAVLHNGMEAFASRFASYISPQERSSAVDFAVTVAKEELARRTIGVRLGYMLGLPDDVTPVINVPVDESTTVDQFLNEVCPRTGHLIHPDQYGRRWILVGDSTTYNGIGWAWAKSQNVLRDSRTLEEVGIELGSELSIRLIRALNVVRESARPLESRESALPSGIDRERAIGPVVCRRVYGVPSGSKA